MLITAAILAIFVYGMIAAMLGTILPDLSARFKLTPAQNGTIALAQAIGLIIASLAVGPLIDYEGKKVGLLLGLTLITIALFWLPNSNGYQTIIVALFVLGIGGGIIVTGANALVSDISSAHRGTTLNLFNLFFGLGGLATPFISANLFKRNSFRLCYTVATLSGLTLLFHIAAPIPPPSGAQPQLWTGAGLIIGSPALWLMAAFLFLYVASEVGVWNWLVRLLIAQGVPEARALNVLSLGFALGLLLGRVAVAPVLHSVSELTVLLAASIAMAIFTYLMLQARTARAAWILVFCAGIAMAPVFPTTLAVVGDTFTQMTATAMGIVITCGWIGLAVSSRIIGSIAGDDPRRLKKALLLLPGMAVAMIVISLALRGLTPAAAH